MANKSMKRIRFRCDLCDEEAHVPLDNLSQIPLCPRHNRPMTPVGNTDEVQAAVTELMQAVARLAAAALRGE